MKKFLLLTVLALAAVMVSACAPHYSEGERVGVVTKLSYKGLIFKSWEGQLVAALPIEVAGQTQPETFRFSSASDSETVHKLNNAMLSGQRVTLVYRQWLISPPTIDTDSVVTDVKAKEAGK